MNADTPAPMTWRPPRRLFWVGFVGSLLFSTILIEFTLSIFHPAWRWAEKWPPDFVDLIVSYCCFGGGTMMFLCMLRIGLVSALSIKAGQIELRTFSKRQVIKLDEIEQIFWRSPPHIWDPFKKEMRLRLTKPFMVEVSGHGKHASINLGIFSPKDKQAIIQIIRNLFINRPQLGWDEFVQAREKTRLLMELEKHRRAQPVPNSETRLLIMACAALIWSILAWAVRSPLFHGVEWFGMAGFPRLIQIMLTYGAMFGASMLLLSLWEIIKYQTTKRTLLALAFSIVGTVMSVMAIWLIVEETVKRR